MTSNLFTEFLLVGDIESSFRAGGTPTLTDDTFDVGPVTWTPNIQNLTRNARRATLSPLPSKTGRRMQQYQFPMDIGGSGTTDASTPPAFGRLLRACGFAETQVAAAGLSHSTYLSSNTRKGVATAAHATDAFAGTIPRIVTLTVDGAATVTVTASANATDIAYSETAVAVTSTGAIPGPNGSNMMLTFSGDLVVGDQYVFFFTPPGHLYSPITDPDSLESMYFHFYAGNKIHRMPGARGTVSLSATAGEFAMFDFTFSGDYENPTDAAFPAVGAYDYGDFPVPPMVEQAVLEAGGTLLACPTTFGFNMGSTVTQRLCANAAGANDGSIITARVPTATFNMDSVPISAFDPYTMMVDGTNMILGGNVGTEAGNIVSFFANGQFSNNQYGDSDGLRKNDLSMNLSGVEGNDELFIFAT